MIMNFVWIVIGEMCVHREVIGKTVCIHLHILTPNAVRRFFSFRSCQDRELDLVYVHQKWMISGKAAMAEIFFWRNSINPSFAIKLISDGLN